VKITERIARELARKHPGLAWIDVTEHGDSERMVLITTPICQYCGCYSSEIRCVCCGASAVRDGEVR